MKFLDMYKSLKLRFKSLIHIGIILIVGILLECFLCNYKHYLTLPTDPLTYSGQQLTTYGLTLTEEENVYLLSYANPSVEIKDINQEIKTIYFDMDVISPSTSKTNIKVYYTDETRENYTWHSRDIEVIDEYENSKYLQEDFFGKSEKMRFTIQLEAGTKIKLNEITFNKVIPFNFAFVRFGTYLLFTLGIYGFVFAFKHRAMIKEYLKTNRIIKIAFVGAAFGLTLLIYGEIYHGFSNYFFQNHGSQISQELVDALLHGQVSLLAKPSEELLALPNPYSPDARVGVPYLWDHLFFEGKYYSYYGLTPVFLFFMPMHLISGKYVNDAYGVLIFTLIGILFLSLAYYKFIKTYFKDCPLYLQLTGYIMLIMSCGAFQNLTRPYFYEVSTSCAFMCMMISLFHLAYSNLLKDEGKISIYNLVFHTFWCSLAVIARATSALYAVCSVIIIIIAFTKRHKDYTWQKAIGYFAAGFVPYIVFGSGQMVYNYLRFGNILDFGIEYSLTINDFTRTVFHPHLAWTSMYNFLFAFPSITDCNYFIQPRGLTFGQSGYYFFETYDCYGIFNRVPLLYSIFILPFLKSDMKFKDRCIYALRYVLPCIIVPFVLVIITWESGYATRYCSDFCWPLVIFIVFVFIKMYLKAENAQDNTKVKLLATLFGVTLIISFMGCMALINYYKPSSTIENGVENFHYLNKYYRRALQLAFWR